MPEHIAHDYFFNTPYNNPREKSFWSYIWGVSVAQLACITGLALLFASIIMLFVPYAWKCNLIFLLTTLIIVLLVTIIAFYLFDRMSFSDPYLKSLRNSPNLTGEQVERVEKIIKGD